MKNLIVNGCNALARQGLVLVTLSLVAGCDGNEKADASPNLLWNLQKQSALAFALHAKKLESDVTTLCVDITAEALTTSQMQWTETMKAWQPLAGSNFGNEAAMSLSWKIQFYPDKKNTTGRQLTQLLDNASDVTPESLADSSVAVQGLGALEWLLFDKANVSALAARCGVIQAVASRLKQSAIEMEAIWQANPWETASQEQRDKDSINVLAGQLDATIKSLSLPMGKPGFPKPYQAQAWRSSQSLALLRSSIEALNTRYVLTLESVLRNKGHHELADRLTKHWQVARDSVPDGDGMNPILSRHDGYRQLMTLANNLEYLKIALADEAAPALGMVVGFNATDGD
ncbi:imelysin family protein [Enterovibrio sp. 27052020O]|uniref:imelysin family protein n=1 Tax=Enterovibrio sp. 27052020O TaxID=3241166 RepID=UPI00389079E5